ncbi:MAG: exodeoxyribonuclease V subunit gamma [Oscillospiraceae bacterium]|nr:exodeoxyribonuclease V subunit gamma [Oscillospiraceae bacterium]
MLHLLIGRDWTANRDEILRRVSLDVKTEKEGRILMVPELISHETERRLCSAAGDTASRYAEVLSFTRLARRVAEQYGFAADECLDAGGRVVAMASAARQLHSRLKAYASVETRPEFLTGLIDAVDEFKRCCISSQDLMAASLETEGSLSQKLEELALLLEGYDSLCQLGKRDPRDQETQLLEQMEAGDFAENHVFYIDGFPDFTRQHLAILEHLIKFSTDVTVSLNCDRVDSPLLAFEKAGDTASQIIRCAKNAGVDYDIQIIEEKRVPLTALRRGLFQGAIVPVENLKVCIAETPYQECLAAAEQILELVRKGCRYRDITVVCADLSTYQPLVNLAFHRCRIPVYLSGKEDILQKSVIATVLSAMDAALGGFEQRSVLRYLRSVLSPIEPDICDLVENYVITWSIRGAKWQEEWLNHPDGLSGVWDDTWRAQLSLLNDARKTAIEPLARLSQGFKDARNLQQQVLALYAFLEDIRLESRLDSLAREMDGSGDNRSAQILNQLWEILLGAMEQLYDVLGNTVWDTETFTRLFQLLLSQYDVGTIPPVLDAVQAGQVGAMRCHQQKHLIVLGAQEGNLPGYTGSVGVLTDQERVTLRELGVPLTGGNMEGIQAEFAEIYGVFCGAMETVTVYSSGDQPSFVCRRLAQMAGGETEVNPQLGAAQTDAFEAGAYLAKWNAAETAALLGVADEYWQVYRRRDYELGRVQREQIDRLYGKTLNLSASQIDRQAECRLSYFLKYGLRAKERKEAAVDPAEFGTYVHAVLEDTAKTVKARGGFPHVSLSETLEIANHFSDEYAKEHFAQLDSERIAYLFRRNSQELRMVVRELWEELQQSQFQPEGFEVNFGSEGGLPAIALPGHDMNAILRGFVDRVDTWLCNGTSYYRVVDYKTGKKDFDYCDVFNGVGLQMLLYLFALQESGGEVVGENPIPAGVQYFPARVPYVSADGRLTEESADKERAKDRKRRGLLLADPEVLQAMEPGDNPKRLCITVKKDGSITGDIATRDMLKILKAYIFTILGKMVDEIASGNVEPNPYTRGSSHSACAWCPYGAICHENEVAGRRNYKTMNAQRFWDEIGREMSRHG